MNPFHADHTALVWRSRHETLRIEPWGPDSLRLRATRAAGLSDEPRALLPPPVARPHIEVRDESARITHGAIAAEVDVRGRVRCLRAATGEPVLEEEARVFRSAGGNLDRAEMVFKAHEEERFYGLGQHPHGYLNQKGCVIALEQVNTRVNIPFALSSRGYGFLWNNPAIGRVELGRSGTRWVAEMTRQIDCWVTVGDTPAAIVERYADATGHAPMLPEWASGFWQCKLRYQNQEELLSVAREYRQRGLPLSVIVIDFFHWPIMGEWRFDPEFWPDPDAMVRELDEMGVKLMVSIWPTVNPDSANADEMRDRGLLVGTERGVPVLFQFVDTHAAGKVFTHYYDATNPEARRYLWERVREGYYRHGIKVFWLDACEPEINPTDYDNLRYHLGNGQEVACIYPFEHGRGFYEGLKGEGEDEIITLCRSAWAGSQRFGAAVWSGDIPSTFESLQQQVRAGLNIGLSGIPWWTTDIGGFHGGEINSPVFRELIVRWFQYGTFCPLFRLHGSREPFQGVSGAANEVWSFGQPAYDILRGLMELRERLRPYVMEQMGAAHERGTPPMRPLFYDFPEDPAAWQVEDQFLFGPDLLVAPVLEEGATARRVYLPAGAEWRDAWSDERHAGGQWLDVAAPLERIPLYLRDGADLPIKG